jgi:hypothetical protein
MTGWTSTRGFPGDHPAPPVALNRGKQVLGTTLITRLMLIFSSSPDEISSAGFICEPCISQAERNFSLFGFQELSFSPFAHLRTQGADVPGNQVGDKRQYHRSDKPGRDANKKDSNMQGIGPGDEPG